MGAKVQVLVGTVDPVVLVDSLEQAIRKIHAAVMASPAWPGDPDRYMAEQLADFLIHMAARAEASAAKGGA